MKLLLFLVMVALLSGCTQSQQEVGYEIETISAECKSGELSDPEVSVEGNSIVIVEPFETPNPCYEVTGNVSLEGKEIVVELRPESTGGACVQCIGEVVGEVTVSNLAEGTYTLKLETPQGKRTTTVSID